MAKNRYYCELTFGILDERKKIAVNTRFLLKNKLEGIGLFTFESVKRIVAAHPEIDFYFLFDRPFDPSFITATNVTPVVLFPPARHPFLWYWWFEVSVAGWLNKNKPDLFLSPDGYASLNSDVPQVLVMHDLAYEHFKDHVAWLTRNYYQYFMPRFAKKAKRIATVSEFSKADIVRVYGVEPAKIDVVYNGAVEVYKPQPENVKVRIKSTYTNGAEYFVYVGSIHPRKNVARLLQAFEQFKNETGSKFNLVIVGRKAWDFEDVDAVFNKMKHQASVKFLGHKSPEELGEIVGSAYAMAYVSLFEGFGIPIVEALSCEVPVITSNVSSMPEAGGDAAILVDPYSVETISTAMVTIAANQMLRNNLIEKGKEQLKKFSWELTAQRLWTCCQQVLNNT